MKKKRYTDEQTAYALRQAGAGTPVKEVCRKLGVTETDVLHLAAEAEGRRILNL